VSQSNSSTPWVYVVGAETEDLGVSLDDGGEGFVELPDGDVVL
jgi:hypothetical protein